MVYFENQSDLEFGELGLERLIEGMSESLVEVYVLNDNEMIELNRDFRQKNELTDVLSFPCDAVVPNLPLGSIVMSASLIKQKAKEFGHSIEEELQLLFIHGFLHLLGFDHEVDSGEHRQKEEEMIRKFGLPASLIVRV
ncbi:rRNA maturation RNase YbeY [Helicobacter kayseriensis]|uniref:rRNA maturation RNase YbeY n=1 Tax=Helicobacter kayseriensis TaxID=2905877 RepID=UPI001E36CCE9|nr:rRNA maturation RNase YbeY [Helicobacter kayseriensis]MCE3047043.1 rRNA maturation RNase YbeY [Helicobacter kayseriensis]MCE3048297.1 rRNA maturation RNase YbeY [Helicobacter kayseriensis]